MLRRSRAKPEIKIAESALASVQRHAAASWPFETGGILVGVETAGVQWITQAIEVPSEERGTHSYRLPANVTPQIVEMVRKEDTRLGYLGDWHSHPSDAHASSLDFRTMRRIARIFRQPQLLLVAKPTRENYAYEFEAHYVSAVAVEVKMSLTGDLVGEAQRNVHHAHLDETGRKDRP